MATESSNPEDKCGQLKLALSEQEKRFESLEVVNKLVLGSTDMDSMLQAILREFLDIFSCDRAWLLYPCDPNVTHYRIPMEQCRPDWPGANTEGKSLPIDEHTSDVFKLSLKAMGPVRFDMEENTLVIDDAINAQFNIKSQMIFAIKPNIGKPWLLGIHNCKAPVIYDKSQVSLFELLGTRLADGLSQLLLYRDTQSLFQNSEVAILITDMFQMHDLLEQLYKDHKDDFHSYLKDNQSIINELANSIDIIRANNAALEFFEANTLAEVKTIFTATHCEHQTDIFIDELYTIVNSADSFRSEIEFRISNNKSINAVISFKIPNVVEDYRSVPVSILDITKSKKTEKVLRRAQKMEAVGQMAGGIAHDFNNLLGIIIGNLSILSMDVDENQKTQITEIEKAAERATKLTKQLLGFSRLQPEHVLRVDINQIIVNLDSLIEHTVTPKIVVMKYLTEDLWLTEINPGDFEDAILNLTLNARDAMKNGGKLTFETENCVLDREFCAQYEDANPGEYILLSISDNGEGISVKQQERIFEPFFTTKPQGKGTGLGLSMVFGFVKRSGGYISVYSELENGTTFKIYLPRSEGETQHVIPLNQKKDALPRGSETILIVDDEVALVELAKNLLQNLGYQIITAINGEQALKALEHNMNISLIITDIVMPGGISGLDIAKQVQTERPNLKIILTSGYTDKSLSSPTNRQLYSSFISKPYSTSELARQIRAVLDLDA